MNQADRHYLAAAGQRIEQLLAARGATPLAPTGLSDEMQLFADQFDALIEALAALRGFSVTLANGNLSQDAPPGIHLLGPIKQLQASLRHLTWQTQQVARGDLDQQVDFLGEFSDAFNQMIQALREKRVAEERVRYLSEHDSLTGLHNRAFFEAELRRLKTADHYPVSFIIADLNRLKEMNDELGHHVGDLLIQKASQVLQSSLEPDETVARIGGDEFALILPGRGPAHAQRVIERIREAESRANRQSNVFPISISLGASTAVDPETLTSTLREADEQMYADKAAQKNRPGAGRGSTSRA